MDEYSPGGHDIVQLRFLCEALYRDYLINLEENSHGQVNNPTSAINPQLNEPTEYIVTFAFNYKIKYNEGNRLIEQANEYLDDTFILLSSCGINMWNLQKWRESGNRLSRCFVNATEESPASLSCQNYYNHRQKYVRKTFSENRLFNAFTSLPDN